MSKIFRIKSIPKFKIKSFITSKFKPKRFVGCLTSKDKCEAQIQREVIEYLDKQENLSRWVLNMKGDPFVCKGVIHFQKNENSGFGDILISYNGFFIMAEIKKCGGVQSEVQQEQEEKVLKSKSQYWIITSVKEIEDKFNTFKKENYATNN